MRPNHVVIVGCAAAVALLGGCQTSLVTIPEVQTYPECKSVFYGQVECQGQACYLPRSVARSDAVHDPITFRYEYGTAYDEKEVPALFSLFSPTTMIGTPLGSNDVLTWATMKVLRDGKEVRLYKASCRASKTRNIFSEGETLTDMRRRALLALRDNIEAQMHNDRAFLVPMAGSADGGKKEPSTN